MSRRLARPAAPRLKVPVRMNTRRCPQRCRLSAEPWHIYPDLFDDRPAITSDSVRLPPLMSRGRAGLALWWTLGGKAQPMGAPLPPLLTPMVEILREFALMAPLKSRLHISYLFCMRLRSLKCSMTGRLKFATNTSTKCTEAKLPTSFIPSLQLLMGRWNRH